VNSAIDSPPKLIDALNLCEGFSDYNRKPRGGQKCKGGLQFALAKMRQVNGAAT
jgi:hypothetical protein